MNRTIARAPDQFRVGVRVRFFNYNLHEAILHKGWTRKRTADAIGVSQSVLQQWLSFKAYPNEERRLQIACVLEVPDDILFPESISGFRLRKQPEPLDIDRETALAFGLLHEHPADSLAEQGDLSRILDKALSTLDDREQLVMRLRFGLDDGSQRSLRHVGLVLGVTGGRVQQIEKNALRKLRRRPRLKEWREEK